MTWRQLFTLRLGWLGVFVALTPWPPVLWFARSDDYIKGRPPLMIVGTEALAASLALSLVGLAMVQLGFKRREQKALASVAILLSLLLLIWIIQSQAAFAT